MKINFLYLFIIKNMITNEFNNNHDLSYLSSATRPLDFNNSAILVYGTVTPTIFYSISKPIDTS
jgi:hypothetical protein